MGRPRKPTKQKKIAGTIRPDRENPAEPEFQDRGLRPPAGLSAGARKVWEAIAPELSELGILKKVQEHQLIMYCNAVATGFKAQKVLDRQGATYKTRTPTGSIMIRKRPEVGIVDTMMKHARMFAVEFGLTPQSQSKVNARLNGNEDQDTKKTRHFA